MSDRTLLYELYDDTEHGSKIRQALSERLIEQGVTHPADLRGLRAMFVQEQVSSPDPTPAPETPRRILDVTTDNFPWMATEPVLEWMRETQPYLLAEEAKQDGFACQNMKDPEQAIDWMNLAIIQKSDWRSLTPAAVRFWKAFYGKWSLWKMKGKVA